MPNSTLPLAGTVALPSGVATSGRGFVATPLGNATVPANGSVEFGMQLGYSGAKPVPVGLTWAGRSCTIVVK